MRRAFVIEVLLKCVFVKVSRQVSNAGREEYECAMIHCPRIGAT